MSERDEEEDAGGEEGEGWEEYRVPVTMSSEWRDWSLMNSGMNLG